ncbi:MAG TPA: methyltransferase domain-containing protein, partial [Dehalococcoidia bacterium]|nr:methyltransferase domain-containing protein [Dehalococcoidia bacterium]
SFDQAYSVWVLHHVGDIAAALREVARVLRPGGRFVVVPQGAQPVGEPDPALELAGELARRVRGPAADRWIGTAEDLPHLAPAAGLRVAGLHELPPHSYEESPETLARAIEQRAFSYLRDLDEGTWKRDVEPIIAAIRALPDAQRAVKHWSRPPPIVILKRQPSVLTLDP